MTKAVHFQGPINAHLYVSSIGASTVSPGGMLSVAVEDVAPDGTVTRLTGGWQVISDRALDTKKSRYLDGKLIQPFHPFTKATEKPLARRSRRAGRRRGLPDRRLHPAGSQAAASAASHCARLIRRRSSGKAKTRLDTSTGCTTASRPTASAAACATYPSPSAAMPASQRGRRTSAARASFGGHALLHADPTRRAARQRARA